MTHEDKNRLISLSEAADLYGFKHGYLNNLIRRKRLVAQKIGHYWLTTPAAMEEFISSRQQRGVYRDDISLDSND